MLGFGAAALMAPTAAADGAFSTSVVKNGVYFKTSPYGNGERIYGKFNQGDRVHFNCYVLNKHGNKWFRDSNHNFIFSGNVVVPKGVPRC